jgi:hypothetical protein
MILTMLTTLSAIVVTGLLAEGRTGGAGRFTALLSSGSVRMVGDIHAWLGFVIMWLAGAHSAGVLVESVLHRENLVRSMITGRKETDDPSEGDGHPVSLWRVLPLMVLLAILGLWLAVGTGAPKRSFDSPNATWQR